MKKPIVIILGAVIFISFAYITMANLTRDDLTEKIMNLKSPATISDPLKNSEDVLSNVSSNKEDAGQDTQNSSGYDVQRETSAPSSGGCGCAKGQASNQTTNAEN